MPRPKKQRCCRRYRADRVFKPQGFPMRDIDMVEISLDEFEVLRLCDYEGLDQTEAGRQMGVSRGTVQRLLYRARRQVVAALLNKNALAVNLRGSEACHDGMHTHPRGRGSRRRRV